ncbi:MAG: KdsC family phosphatase [Bacteroidota bacterium]|jgi:3-deoxy-D-manno-octulosonate 8-phosphate phosphatase (KDO 8-P phosphatase)
MNYKEQLGKISTFIFDVDGVFTDNIVWLTSDGEQMRTANVKDGYAVQLAIKCGYQIAIISGGKSEAVRTRFEKLGVTEVHLGSSNKKIVYETLQEKWKFQDSEVCYMGDDIPDLPLLQRAGLACCPADAAPEIKAVSHYISNKKGGEGCVRDILEQSLKLQGHWLKNESLIW